MTGDLTFVDTNVLVYAYDRREGDKHLVARNLLVELWRDGTGTLSTQVLQEFYVTVTRKLVHPLPRSKARALVRRYGQWVLLPILTEDVVAAAELEESEQLSFWDALIVTSAGRAGAQTIVSEDFQAGRQILGIRIENPFTA